MMFGFEKLNVWQLAVEFADAIYAATAGFPAAERFGLTSQIRRSAVSVSANIAEGSGRGTKRDFARFVEIAFGSLMETISHLTICKRQSLLNETCYRTLYDQASTLARMLSGLRRSLTTS